jgi:hypothetical protein
MPKVDTLRTNEKGTEEEEEEGEKNGKTEKKK